MSAFDPDMRHPFTSPTENSLMSCLAGQPREDITKPARGYQRSLKCRLSMNPAQALFPEFDHAGRKFTPSDACASAGFRPHFKQGLVLAEKLTLRYLVGFGMRPSLSRHFQ